MRIIVIVVLAAASATTKCGAAAAACTTASDCNLNGDCVSGVCVCDAAWSGAADCGAMSFQVQDAKHRPGMYNSTQSTWGGIPIKGNDDRWHLIHAQMVNSCPLGSWTTDSMIARSVAETINGPYTFEAELVVPFAHNPVIRRNDADKSYTIFMIGGWHTNTTDCRKKTQTSATVEAVAVATDSCTSDTWEKTCGAAMPGPSHDCCGPKSGGGNSGCGIATAHATSLDGPWTVAPLLITDQWDSDDVYCAHTNPSPHYLANGSIVMAFNAGFCHNHLETIGTAISDHGWGGPWRLLSKNAILHDADGSIHHCEDPFIWKTARGWHLLVHNQEGPQKESAYAHSVDGLNWTLAPHAPYDCVLKFTDGTTATASGCGNRPQIVFDESTAKPLLLTNGAMAAKPNGGKGTYTLFRPITQ